MKRHQVEPLRLDQANEWVLRGTERLRLAPKEFAVLCYLVEHPGRLVSKDEILREVWVDTAVSDWALTRSIRELRKALRDDARAPHYIETVHRRGYRFIGPLAAKPARSPELPVRSPDFQVWGPVRDFVGREAELAQLERWFEKAQRGERQMVFVTGEPGIGKTAIVEAFLAGVAARGEAWVGHGQCIELFGAGEAYLPLLAALGQMCRESRGQRLIELLTRHAPTWLLQMPALLDGKEMEALSSKVGGASRDRMLREIAEALEALTADRPLALVLEDLHWSDTATLDLVSFLAQRRQSARLLVLATYRPVEVILRNHPLKGVKQELRLHGQCEEIAVRPLSVGAVGDYLVARFAADAHQAPPFRALARMIHERTDGNPLFIVNIVNDLVARDTIVKKAGRLTLTEPAKALVIEVPESLQEMVEKQFDRLATDDQQLLTAASVAGAVFSAAVVAAGLREDVKLIEARCDGLARREQFLSAQRVVEWPDGTIAGGYGFVHALHREAVRKRVTAVQGRELHQRIGERAEAGYGERAGEIAAELALHFEQGQSYDRAVEYLRQAAERARLRSAHHEAINHLKRALELLKALPETPERLQQELTLQISLGPLLAATKGFAAPEVGVAYNLARELCRRVGETPQLFPTLVGLWSYYLLRVELQTARDLEEQIFRLAQRAEDPVLLLEAHRVSGASSYWLGNFALARARLEQGITLYDPEQHRSHGFLYWDDPGVACLSYLALTLWHLGFPDQALRRSREAVALAQDLSYPLTQAFALSLAAACHQYRGEEHVTKERAESAVALSVEHGFPLWGAFSTILLGWALARQGQARKAIVQIRRGLANWQATGVELSQSYFLSLLAESSQRAGQIQKGIVALATGFALVRRAGNNCNEAELHRLKGELILKQSEDNLRSKAEECFQQAIDIARRQGSKSLELRAVMSSSRLGREQGKKKDARSALAEIYAKFTEGFDTADLKEAKTLLDELSR